MKAAYSIVFCVVIILSAHSESLSAEPVSAATSETTAASPQTPEQISTKGVVCREDGTPIAGATVILRADLILNCKTACDLPSSDVIREGITNSRGEFQFKNVSVDRVGQFLPPISEIVVKATGYGMRWRLCRADLGRIVLSPSTRIRGRLLLDDKTPAAGVALRVVDLRPLDIQKASRQARSLSLSYSTISPQATTGIDGRFEISGLPPDHRVALLVEHRDLARSRIYVATTDTPQPPVQGIRSDQYHRDIVPVHVGDFTTIAPAGAPCAGASNLPTRINPVDAPK